MGKVGVTEHKAKEVSNGHYVQKWSMEYDNGHYVQNWSIEGITKDNMCRS